MEACRGYHNDTPEMMDENPVATAAKLESHEKVCTERYGEIKQAFLDVNARLDKINYGIIGLLIALVGWLLINGQPWTHAG